VSGDRVVWEWYDGSDAEVFTWTPTGGVLRLTDNSTVDMEPRVSGDRVVWQMMSADLSTREICTWTPASGVVRLTDGAAWDYSPQVDGDRIVWVGGEGDQSEIFVWSPSGGMSQLTHNAEHDDSPTVSGERVVWSSGLGGTAEIHTWTPVGGALRLGGMAQADPRVSGERVVWSGSPEGNNEIYTWTPDAGVVRITDNSGYDAYMQVSGDRVVWSLWDRTGGEVFTWTPVDGVVRLSANATSDRDPQVSGDRVVWWGGTVGDGVVGLQDEIHTWTPTGGAIRITDNDLFDAFPGVSGGRLVWSGRSEIFTCVPGVTSSWTYSYSLDKIQGSVPDTLSEGPGSVRSFDGLADGVWYFHVRACDEDGSWGGPTHRGVQIDTHRPTTRAPFAAVARRGRSATMRYKVVDPRPGSSTASGTLKVTDRAGRVMRRLTYEAQPVNTMLAAKLRVPRAWRPGTYRFFVYAKDAAGNLQAKVGSNTLRVK
jgi:hypothetical protein